MIGLEPEELLAAELQQRRETGHEVEPLEGPVGEATGLAECERLFSSLEQTPLRADWPYAEPPNPSLPASAPVASPPPDVADRIHAAWLGRAVGCTLGRPVEGWTRTAIREYLTLAGAYPLGDYVPALEPLPAGFELHPRWREAVRGRIRCAARDDDTDYTVLALHVLETHGREFTTEQVADVWLSHLPILLTYTAERVAYRNLILGLCPPATATHRNPYREWIGAQIRADLWGYVSPGDPAGAARLAGKDASLSHTGNGLYGALWAAALIAACFVADDAREALELARLQIPARSRLAEALAEVDALHARGLTWEQARDVLEELYGGYHFAHSVNNAAAVALALLYGERDFSRTVCLAVQAGWDTDCNGATAGSAFGALHGREALSPRWTEPLGDRLRSAIVGYDHSRLSELAERTARLAAA